MFAAFTRGSDTDPSTSDAADIDEVRRMPSSAGSSPERAPRSAGLLEVFDTNETNLYAFGRSLGARVQDLMADTSPLARWEREEASAHELSFHVAEALDKQHKLNQVGAPQPALLCTSRSSSLTQFHDTLSSRFFLHVANPLPTTGEPWPPRDELRDQHRQLCN